MVQTNADFLGNKIFIENKNSGVDNLEMEELLVFGSQAIIL